MKAKVFTKNDNPTHCFPATVIKDVDFEVTRQEIEDQQEKRMHHDADTICRIKIVDEKTNKFVWFDITPTMRRGKPGIEVTAIGKVNETVRKNVIGAWKDTKWREIVIDNAIPAIIDGPLPKGSQIWLQKPGEIPYWSEMTAQGEPVAGQDVTIDPEVWQSVKIRVPV